MLVGLVACGLFSMAKAVRSLHFTKVGGFASFFDCTVCNDTLVVTISGII